MHAFMKEVALSLVFMKSSTRTFPPKAIIAMATNNSDSVSFTDGLRGLKTYVLLEKSDPLLRGEKLFLNSPKTKSVPFISFLFHQRKISMGQKETI